MPLKGIRIGGKRKYGNEPVEVDGLKFHSKAEANYYLTLKMLERQGEIFDLCADKKQLKFQLVVNGHKISSYTPDFRWMEKTGEVVYADLKGGYFDGRESHGASQAYRIRKKLMLALHGVEVREVKPLRITARRRVK